MVDWNSLKNDVVDWFSLSEDGPDDSQPKKKTKAPTVGDRVKSAAESVGRGVVKGATFVADAVIDPIMDTPDVVGDLVTTLTGGKSDPDPEGLRVTNAVQKKVVEPLVGKKKISSDPVQRKTDQIAEMVGEFLVPLSPVTKGRIIPHIVESVLGGAGAVVGGDVAEKALGPNGRIVGEVLGGGGGVVAGAKWTMPVDGKVTSGPGKRKAPTKGASTNHAGVDLKSPTGTPVKAPTDGKVTKVGRNHEARGNWVEIEDAEGNTHRFLHLSGYNVKPGMSVKQGQLFARVGATGRVTGPHLHWSVHTKDGKRLNPIEAAKGEHIAPDGLPGNQAVRPMAPEEIARIMNDMDAVDAADVTPPKVPDNEQPILPDEGILDFDSVIEKARAGRDINPQEQALLNDAGIVQDPRSGVWMPRDKAYDLGFEDWRENNLSSLPNNNISEFPQNRQVGSQLTPDEIAEQTAAGLPSAEVVPLRVGDEGIGGGQQPPREPPSGGGGDGTTPPGGQGIDPAYEGLSPKDKLLTVLREAKSFGPEQRRLRHEERKRRVAAMLGRGRRSSGEAGLYAEKGALKGELPNLDIEPIRSKFSQEEIDSLLDGVKNSRRLSPLEGIAARDAMVSLIDGKLPTKGEMKYIYRVYPEVVEGILDKAPLAEKVRAGLLKVYESTRGAMASGDVSFGGRQGIMMLTRPAYWRGTAGEFKALSPAKGDEVLANQQERIVNSPHYDRAKESGLHLMDMGAHGNREEFAARSYAEDFPFLGQIIKGSNRAYTYMANELRFGMFSDILNKWQKLGVDIDDPELTKTLAEYINVFTGRATFGRVEGAVPLLNLLLFAPRFVFSTFRRLDPRLWGKMALVDYKQGQSLLLKEALRDTGAYVGMVYGLLSLAGMAGYEVEWDPRTPTGLKIKHGKTTYDVGGGMVQTINFLSKIMTGSKKTGKGDEVSLSEGKFGQDTHWSTLARFVRTKLHPTLSYFINAKEGENVVGEKFDVIKDTFKSLTPMYTNAVAEHLEEHGIEGLPALIGAWFGMGLNTYDPPKTEPQAPTGGQGDPSWDSLSSGDSSWESLK